MTDGPPRHHPVEPPFDPDYDPPPSSTTTPPADRAAERALLHTLITNPTLGERLANHLHADDFYWPVHGQIWDAWHHLAATDGTPPDAVTLNAHLVTSGHRDPTSAARVHTLAEILTTDASPTLAEHYARIIRNTSRLRAVADLATGLRQIATEGTVDKVDHYLGEAVQRLDDAVMRFGPTPGANNSGLRDLTWILTGQAPEIPPPAWVQHEAGHALFYAGKVNGVFGDPETAKTWLAQCAVVEALAAGGTAAMIDVDHNGENHTAARLMLLGARPDAIADPTRFRYYDPEDGDQLRAAISDITAHRPDVVLVDSLGEVFPMLGLNTNDGDEITGGLRLISKPADTGSCVIFIDHLPKSSEARSTGFAIGSIAKKRAIRGSYIRAEERVKPAPGQVGKISLFIEKDTAGELRRATPGGKYLGTFVLDSTQPHITTWRVEATSPISADGTFRPTHLMETISRYIEDNDGCTTRDLRESIDARPKTVQAAVERLVTEGFVSRIPGKNNAKLHHSIALYRETEDDTA